MFFTSDQHYGHQNIIKYCKRPFSSVEEMNEILIKSHNAVVSPKDIVYYLGDFCFLTAEKAKFTLSRLNGKKTLILGNHDQVMLENDFSSFFTEIVYYKEIKYNKHLICMFHYGCRVWNQSSKDSWLLYGHSHGNLPSYGRSVDVGVDSKMITPEYRPVSVEEVEKFMTKVESSR